MHLRLLVATTLLLTSVACANKVKLDESKARFSTEPNGQGVTATVSWLKNKGHAVDLLLTLENNYDKPVSISKDSLQINVEGRVGRLKKSEFKEVLAPKSKQKGLMIFKFENETPESGSAIVTIAPIQWIDEADPKKIPALKFQLPLYILQ